ncbi:MAG: type II toxin-antitoxin system death-on-curing family toxin [Saprospiraceae bacterium]|nr:type II toxin-antitoxin system death-on-curing family toxin [Saprospiraceae bacterium]
MISREIIFKIHSRLIQEFGGTDGLRDAYLLDAAINRPFGGLGDAEFYPLIEEKAAAIVESIVKNHPILDGNKRTGYALMSLMLERNGKEIAATED